MRRLTINIPNLISSFRLVIVPILLYFAWSNKTTLFLVFLVCSLLSDIVDGFIARRLNQSSELGAKLDSWCDLATYLTIPICAWWLWPDLIHREAPFVVTALISYTFPIIFGLLRYARLTSYHTRGAKLSAVFMGVAVLILFVGGSAWPFRRATLVLVLSGLEEIAITIILPEWHSDVPSFWHARKLVQR